MRAQGRTAAIAGAVVAVGAATMMGLTGIASAAPGGSCLENVNVRAEPSVDSRIVALCEAGTAVDTGATRNGFVRIINLDGWAAEEYIAVDDATPANSAPADTRSTDTTPSDTAQSDDELREPSNPSTTEPVGGDTTDDGTPDTPGDATTDETASDDEPASGPGGGLFG